MRANAARCCSPPERLVVTFLDREELRQFHHFDDVFKRHQFVLCEVGAETVSQIGPEAEVRKPGEILWDITDSTKPG